MENAHLADIQRYFANVGITASALRNLGAEGVVESAREFLAKMDMTELRSIDPSNYADWLERQTQLLMHQFPQACRTCWGPARKAVNIFMTMAALSRHLSEADGLTRLEHVMETPLDGIAEKKLRSWGKEQRVFSRADFPKWKSIKALDITNSNKYQQIALALAKEKSVPRGRLDIMLWRPKSE